MSTETVPRGDCFTVALGSTAGAVEAGHASKVFLAHGLPVGRGPHNFGVRYWHAWTEYVMRGQWMVLDLSNGGRLHVPRSEYYKVGQIDHRQHVWRYTLAEAEVASASDDDRAGPWVPGWEQMGL